MMRRSFTRRNFLKMGALVASTLAMGGALSACASESQGDTDAQTSEEQPQTAAQQDPPTPPQPIADKGLAMKRSRHLLRLT